MKNLITLVLFVVPFLGFGQEVDSVRVTGEVDSLVQECRGAFGAGNVEEALEKIEEAKQVCRRGLGEACDDYAKCILVQARIMISIGNLNEAEVLVQQAKYIRENLWGKEHPNYAAILNVLAIIYQSSGDYDGAIKQYLESKNILERSTGKEHPEYAKILNNLALAYQEAGDYDNAFAVNLEAMEVRERTVGKESIDYAMSLNNTGFLYLKNNDYDLALPMLLEARAITEKILGKVNFDYIRTTRNLGVLYLAKGNYDKAYPYMMEAEDIARRMLGEEHPEYANALNLQIDYYRQTGDMEKALSIAIKTTEIREKIYGPQHPSYTESLNNLANIYQDMGEIEKSLELYSEALKIIAEVFGKISESYATTLMNLGVSYTISGNGEIATELLKESLNVIDSLFGTENYLYATALANLATTFNASNDIKRAITLESEALVIIERIAGKGHPDYALYQQNLAIDYGKLGDYQNAAAHYLSSNTAMKNLLRKYAAYSTDREMMQYKSTFNDDFRNLLDFVQSHPTDSLLYAAYDNALFLNNALLFNAIAREKGIARADSSTHALHAEWKSCRYQLGTLYSQPIANRDSARVVHLEEQSNEYEKELVRRSPEFAETQKEVFWNDVNSQLQTGEAAIEFVNYGWQDRKSKRDTTMYAALVLLPNATTPAFIPLCQESDMLAALNQPQCFKQGYYDRLYRGIKPRANAKTEGLYQLLWQPLDSLLAGTKRIYYAPSGLLHRINLAAVPAAGVALGSRYELVQLGSTRQLVVKNNQAFTQKDAILFGGINYEAESLNPQEPLDSLAVEDALSFGSSLDFNGLTLSLRGGEWNYLEGTAKEATDIAKLLKKKGFQAKTMGGHAATEEAFKAIGQGSPSPRVLHVATHGFFFPDPKNRDEGRGIMDEGAVFKQSDNPMIRSGLILAGANTVWKGGQAPAGEEDGILTAYEISQMNLSNTELVVLSACETGLGDIEGNEGVYGLQRAFKIAGAKYLIMSLWDVPDAETAEFMTLFYKEWLSGCDIQAAFRSAQRAMHEQYPQEPFLWAGFVLVE